MLRGATIVLEKIIREKIIGATAERPQIQAVDD